MPFDQDLFTGTDATKLTAHTPDVGTSWTQHPNSTGDDAQIKTNRAGCTYAGGLLPQFLYCGGTPASAEYDVSADLFVNDNQVSECGLLGRMNTATKDWYQGEYDGTSGAWELYKLVSGSATLLGSSSQTLSAGSTYAMKMELRNAAKKIFVDGVQVISSADNAVTAVGKAGIIFDTLASPTGITHNYHLDNFVGTDSAVRRAGVFARQAVKRAAYW